MKIDLGTLDLTALISLFYTLVVLCGLLWAFFSPSCKEKKRKKKEASFLRGSIRLYLDVLNDKLKRILLDQSPLSGNFEKLAKQNHDALEQFFLCSDPLEFEEREKLRAFVRFFKGIPEMNKEDFDAYKTKLEGLMKVFPEEKENSQILYN
ncbi:hypothetical protein ES702_03950 [subsurface metagenome]